MYTRFMDMHSGGGAKTPYEYIFIELPYDEAIDYFQIRFERNPCDVTCDCCGPDFSIISTEDIDVHGEDVLIINKSDL